MLWIAKRTMENTRMDQEESVRGRGKNKYFWTEKEMQALIEILQDMACDPAWKTDGGFKNNYITEKHKEAKGMWDFKFPYLNQLELVYGKDRATGAAAQGFEDAIQTMEADQKNESGGETLGDYFPYFSFEEEYDVNSEAQSTPSVRNAPSKQKRPLTSKDKVAKRKKPMTSLNVGAQLTQLNAGFCTFVEALLVILQQLRMLWQKKISAKKLPQKG